MTELKTQAPPPAPSHTRVVRRLVLVAVAMFGFGFALAPFYSQICAALGIQVADAPRQRTTLGPPSAQP